MSSAGSPQQNVSPIAVSPAPSDEEFVAIFAALELAWPRSVLVGPAPTPESGGSWKWSGRWWNRRA